MSELTQLEIFQTTATVYITVSVFKFQNMTLQQLCNVIQTNQNECHGDDKSEDISPDRLVVLSISFGKEFQPFVDVVLAKSLVRKSAHNSIKQRFLAPEVTVCEWQLARLFKQKLNLSASSTSTAAACEHLNKVIRQCTTMLLYCGKQNHRHLMLIQCFKRKR